MLDFFLEDNFLIIKTKMESHTIEIKTCQIIVVTVNIFFYLKWCYFVLFPQAV